MSGRHVYVYYRIDPTRADEIAARVDALLDALRPSCGASPRCMRRCDDTTTWMEVYEGIADLDAFLAAMQATVRSLGLDRALPDGRHLECFDERVAAA